MRRQIAWAMLTEVFVMGSAIALLKLAATLLGPEGFGEYALSRRVVGLIYLPLVMGLGIAAPRYIAIARSRADGDFSESGIVVSTLSAGSVPAVAVALLMNLVPQSSAQLLFGTQALARVIPPACLAIAGIALHSMVYAVFRGRSETGLANSMHLLNLGLVPLAAFVAADQGAAAIVTVTGAGWVLVSVIGLAVLLYRQRAE